MCHLKGKLSNPPQKHTNVLLKELLHIVPRTKKLQLATSTTLGEKITGQLSVILVSSSSREEQLISDLSLSVELFANTHFTSLDQKVSILHQFLGTLTLKDKQLALPSLLVQIITNLQEKTTRMYILRKPGQSEIILPKKTHFDRILPAIQLILRRL